MRIGEFNISQNLRDAITAPKLRRLPEYFDAEVSGVKPVIAIEAAKAPRGLKAGNYINLCRSSDNQHQIMRTSWICLIDGLVWIGLAGKYGDKSQKNLRMDDIRKHAIEIKNLIDSEEAELCSFAD